MALKKSIILATEYFVHNVLMSDLNVYEGKVEEEAYASSIKINGDENYDIQVYIGEKSLKKMSSLFLYNDEPDEEILIDLVNEIANVIVGRAKVEASEKLDLKFDISTPQYLGDKEEIPNNDFEINFSFEDEVFAVVGHKH